MPQDPSEACPSCDLPRKDWSENYGRGYMQDEMLFCSGGCAMRWIEKHAADRENAHKSAQRDEEGGTSGLQGREPRGE